MHLAMRRNQAIAKVAMARKLAVRLFWMCGVDGITKSGKKSVRTRGSPS
jgi:hypothetical protein